MQDFQEPEDTAIYNDIVALDYTKLSFKLSQNEPSPFSDYTKLKSSITNSDIVSLEIWDNLRRRIFTSIDHRLLNSGNYTTDYNSGNLPAGVYHYP